MKKALALLLFAAGTAHAGLLTTLANAPTPQEVADVGAPVAYERCASLGFSDDGLTINGTCQYHAGTDDDMQQVNFFSAVSWDLTGAPTLGVGCGLELVGLGTFYADGFSADNCRVQFVQDYVAQRNGSQFFYVATSAQGMELLDSDVQAYVYQPQIQTASLVWIDVGPSDASGCVAITSVNGVASTGAFCINPPAPWTGSVSVPDDPLNPGSPLTVNLGVTLGSLVPETLSDGTVSTTSFTRVDQLTGGVWLGDATEFFIITGTHRVCHSGSGRDPRTYCTYVPTYSNVGGSGQLNAVVTDPAPVYSPPSVPD